MSQPISRRQVLQGGLAALATSAVPAALASAATPDLPTYTAPAPSLSPGQSPPRGLAAVTRVLSGVGVYVGNDWFNWDDTARRFAMAKVRSWGFDFICPKVGGYGRTWYRDEGHLRRWAEDARGVGLGFAPFIYCIPETAIPDAKISAQIARVVGIANVDLEDEWGAKRGNPGVTQETTGYKGAEMAAFGRVYRDEAGDLPIIANGYGDPITRFGPADSGFPNAEMMTWADVYSPQWYIGVWSRYHRGGVQAALDWGKDECRQALGPDFPLVPSIDLSSSYTPDSLFPLADTLTLMQAMRAYQAPVFVWEYNLMTPQHAEALLGPPEIQNVRVGRVRKTGLEVVCDTHVPARTSFTQQTADGKPDAPPGQPLNLTHSREIGKLAAGTPYPLTVQATTIGGSSAVVPLTVLTQPATPGVSVLAVVPERVPEGHVVLHVTLENTLDAPVAEVAVTSAAVDGASVMAPDAFPFSLGALATGDWATRTADRVSFAVVLAKTPPGSPTLTLHLTGRATGAPDWSAAVPVTLPQER